MQRSPIACRVSRVALPTCGSSTTLSIAINSGGMCGSSTNTSSPAPLMMPALERRDQCRFVDDRSAGDVDQCPLLAQRGEHLGIDDIPRRVAARDRQRRGSRPRRRATSSRARTRRARPAACVRCRRLSSPSPRRAAAIALPMRPRPRIPTFRPLSLVVSSGPRFSHWPAWTKRFRRAKPRPVIRIKRSATSATSSVSTSGVLVTFRPRCLQYATGTPS